jgi:UDP-glucose 4-epimerase
MKKKILVTGGAGYIGAHSALQLIHAGYEPVIIDNFSKSDETLLEGLHKLCGYPPKFHKGNCLDKNFLLSVFKDAGPFHGVIHFAAFKSVGESVQQPTQYYQNNLGSLLTLLEVMEENNLHDLIFSSSCTVYGQPDVVPVDESAPFKRAESPYGATKQMSERILEDVCVKGFRIISLRYFNPIGAHPSALLGELPIGTPNNLVPFITQTAAGVRDKLTVYGNDYNTPDGTCIRDFIHVMDIANAHVKAAQFLGKRTEPCLFEAYNLGTGVGVSVLELVKLFIDVTKVNFSYTIGPRRQGDIENVYADPQKINKSLGWKAQFTLSECLLHAWQWEKKIRGI